MKNNQKCVRLSDKTLAFIESFEGNGFSQKLETMIEIWVDVEPELMNSIAELEAEEQRLTESVGKLRGMEQSLKQIKRYLDDAKKLTENVPLPGQLKIG